MNQFRQEFGEENVLLVDNGDLFQGTPVSQVQLLEYAAGRSEDPLAKCDRGRVCVTKLNLTVNGLNVTGDGSVSRN